MPPHKHMTAFSSNSIPQLYFCILYILYFFEYTHTFSNAFPYPSSKPPSLCAFLLFLFYSLFPLGIFYRCICQISFQYMENIRRISSIASFVISITNNLYVRKQCFPGFNLEGIL